MRWATVITNVFPFGTSAASLTGVSGQVTLTASYSGLSSSLTFVASAAARPCPMITTSFLYYGIYEDVATFTNVDLPDCRTVTSPVFSSVEWISSDPRVISVSGSSLRTVGVGITDITLRYTNLQTVYRVMVPPVGRLGIVQP